VAAGGTRPAPPPRSRCALRCQLDRLLSTSRTACCACSAVRPFCFFRAGAIMPARTILRRDVGQYVDLQPLVGRSVFVDPPAGHYELRPSLRSGEPEERIDVTQESTTRSVLFSFLLPHALVHAAPTHNPSYNHVRRDWRMIDEAKLVARHDPRHRRHHRPGLVASSSSPSHSPPDAPCRPARPSRTAPDTPDRRARGAAVSPPANVGTSGHFFGAKRASPRILKRVKIGIFGENPPVVEKFGLVTSRGRVFYDARPSIPPSARSVKVRPN